MMSQVLGAFGLLDFTILRPDVAGPFKTCKPFISFLILNFLGGGRGPC
jgi:hypothetical protein